MSLLKGVPRWPVVLARGHLTSLQSDELDLNTCSDAAASARARTHIATQTPMTHVERQSRMLWPTACSTPQQTPPAMWVSTGSHRAVVLVFLECCFGPKWYQQDSTHTHTVYYVYGDHYHVSPPVHMLHSHGGGFVEVRLTNCVKYLNTAMACFHFHYLWQPDSMALYGINLQYADI